MSLLEKKLSVVRKLIPFHPIAESEPEQNVPPRQHNFENWQTYINSTMDDLSRQTYLRCQNQCKYDVTMMLGKKVDINENAEMLCNKDCSVKWLSPFYRYTGLAHSKAEKDFQICLKGENKFEMESKDLLECKRVMFNSYLDSVLEFEQQYLQTALEKYS